MNIKNRINSRYLTALKVVGLSTKLYYFIKPIYLRVTFPPQRPRDIKAKTGD